LAVLKLATISVFHLSKRCSIPACSCIVKIFRFLVFPTCLFPHLPLITASTGRVHTVWRNWRSTCW
jgi:hypothetical protein